MQATTEQPESLQIFLQKYLGKPYPPAERDGPTRYSAAFVDLRDDGVKEAIVYLTGAASCGSGGCDMLILAPESKSYRVVVTSTTITRLPIRVLSTKSHGWHDIAVQVAGGGIQGFEAILSFNGKTYPENPAVPPARASAYGKFAGRVTIDFNETGQLLYPNERLLGQLPDGSEQIVPGDSVGKLRLGMKTNELKVSWQGQPDSVTRQENACKNTELIWFDNDSRWHVPAVRAHIADGLVFQITSEWDRRFKIDGIGIPFGKRITELQAAMPEGELLQLKGSASERRSGADELFWVVSGKGIAFGLDYPMGSTPEQRLGRQHPVYRIVESVTIFRPQNKFQPHGCVNSEQPLVPAEASGAN